MEVDYSIDEVSVYTDGSCNTKHHIGAWAAIIINGSEKKTINGHAVNTTHQRMELAAVIEAIAFLNQNKDTITHITLYTDSQYVTGLTLRKEKLLATDFITNKNKQLPNADLITRFYKESENLHLTITKVKSHQKISQHEKLNSEADRMCRKIVRELAERIPSIKAPKNSE